MKQLKMWMLAAILICGTAAMFTSCAANEDNATPTPTPTPEPTADIPAQLKQGVWTEFDTILVATGKATMEELANMPTVGMNVEGDKAYFFTYTAEGADDLVEGKISYNNTTGTGSITFPTIADNPLSGQTVNFSAIVDDVVEFELNYEGQTTTAAFTWLCENLDNWGEPATNEEWEELMAYYQTISEDMGPDPSIDWGDLEAPLVWDEVATTRGNTRMVTAILEGVSAGLEMFASLFEEDPNEVINGKLDAITGKLDEVLANQQVMNLKLNEINDRLVTIAETIDKNTTFGIFNDRNKTYYNPLDVQITKYFNNAYDLYIKNKSDLSKVSADLGDYGKKWVGDGAKYADLTWAYIKYLTTVKHSKYGTGMDKIYDGLTFDKYPWEHLGTGDRLNYRAFDLTMIVKCLFMIDLYSTYGGLDEKDQKGLYNIYKDYKKNLYDFCSFNISDPNKFLVCQIPGAHFVMRKELQKYNYAKEVPYGTFRYGDDPYYPEWHEAGSIKIENPKTLKDKLILDTEAKAIDAYYKEKFYKNETRIWWMRMLVDGTKVKDIENNDIEMAGGAVYAKAPAGGSDNKPTLMLSTKNHRMGTEGQTNGVVEIRPVMQNWSDVTSSVEMGRSMAYMGVSSIRPLWNNMVRGYDSNIEYYAAIVEKRY